MLKEMLEELEDKVFDMARVLDIDSGWYDWDEECRLVREIKKLKEDILKVRPPMFSSTGTN